MISFLSRILGLERLVAAPVFSSSSVAMLAALNEQRSKYGLKPLKLEPKLHLIALNESICMNRSRKMDHFCGGSTPWSRATAVGYKYNAMSENIAWCPSAWTAAQVVALWMSSSGHRANILGSYTEVGFGQVGDYWTLDFATPASWLGWFFPNKDYLHIQVLPGPISAPGMKHEAQKESGESGVSGDVQPDA